MIRCVDLSPQIAISGAFLCTGCTVWRERRDAQERRLILPSILILFMTKDGLYPDDVRNRRQGSYSYESVNYAINLN
jgi:hypothetical protein